MRILIALLVACLLTSTVFAYKIQEMSITVDLEKKQEIYTISLLATEKQKSFEFYHKGELTAKLRGGSKLHVESLNDKKIIYFPRELKPGEKITFTITAPLEVTGEYLHKAFISPAEVEKFTFYVIFPKGIMPEVRTFNLPKPNCCASLSFQSSTSIPPQGIALSNGRVILMWQKSLSPGEEFVVGIKVPEKSGISPLHILLMLSILVAFGLGIIYSRRKKKEELAVTFLNEEEQKIVEYIKRNGGEVLQENIWKSGILPFSRPKVSRIISELEQRGIIVREPYKKTFKVRLNM